MSEAMKVSVIVPIYRVEKYLSECIESIRAQDYKNIEIILVDDGSDDESGRIADKYANEDERIVVIHKTNGGVSSARNAGLERASGEYVCFVDGDDYVSSDYVSYLLNFALETNAEIALTTQMFSNFEERQVDKEVRNVYNSEAAIIKMLCYDIPIGCYSKIFKRSFLKVNNICFREELFIGEGFNFNMDSLQRADKIAISNRRIYYYRRDNNQSATSVFKKEKCENGIYALQVIKDNLFIKSEAVLKAWEFANWRTYSDMYDIMAVTKAKKIYPQLYKEYKAITKSKAKYAFCNQISKKQKLRALVMRYCPYLIPLLLKLRKSRVK